MQSTPILSTIRRYPPIRASGEAVPLVPLALPQFCGSPVVALGRDGSPGARLLAQALADLNRVRGEFRASAAGLSA